MLCWETYIMRPFMARFGKIHTTSLNEKQSMVALTQSQSVIQVRCNSQRGEADINCALEAGLHAALKAGYLGSSGRWAHPAAPAVEAVICHILLRTYGATSALPLARILCKCVCLRIWLYACRQVWQQPPQHSEVGS